MTTKKQLRTMLEEEKTEKAIALEGLADAVKQNTEVEKLADYQRIAIRVLNTRLDEVEDSLSCARCSYIDENGKKLRPQKCACCRRGAKDNYKPDKPVAEANVISDDFLKSTEATT